MPALPLFHLADLESFSPTASRTGESSAVISSVYFMKKQKPDVLKVLSETAAKQAALSLAEVKEALRIGSKVRQQAEARVPHAAASSRNRFR